MKRQHIARFLLATVGILILLSSAFGHTLRHEETMWGPAIRVYVDPLGTTGPPHRLGFERLVSRDILSRTRAGPSILTECSSPVENPTGLDLSPDGLPHIPVTTRQARR